MDPLRFLCNAFPKIMPITCFRNELTTICDNFKLVFKIVCSSFQTTNRIMIKLSQNIYFGQTINNMHKT